MLWCQTNLHYSYPSSNYCCNGVLQLVTFVVTVQCMADLGFHEGGFNKSLPGDLSAFIPSVEYLTQYPDKVILLFTPLLIHCQCSLTCTMNSANHQAHAFVLITLVLTLWWISKLSTDNTGICLVPKIITYCNLPSIHADLHTPLTFLMHAA